MSAECLMFTVNLVNIMIHIYKWKLKINLPYIFDGFVNLIEKLKQKWVVYG